MVITRRLPLHCIDRGRRGRAYPRTDVKHACTVEYSTAAAHTTVGRRNKAGRPLGRSKGERAGIDRICCGVRDMARQQGATALLLSRNTTVARLMSRRLVAFGGFER